MRILIFSDPHITKGSNCRHEMLENGIKIINQTQADYYIASGDITDTGTLEDYRYAQERLSKIKKRVMFVPGNRDAKNVGDLLWNDFFGSRYFVEENPSKRIKILGLDSSQPDESTGQIGKQGIKRIDEAFRDLDETWTKILVFHHHTLPIHNMGRQRGSLQDAGDIIAAIIRLKIDIIIHGHKHISNIYRLSNGNHFSLIINAGTLSSVKTRYNERNSITLLEYDRVRKKAQVSIKEVNNSNNKWKLKFNNSIIIPKPVDEFPEKYISIVHISNSEFSKDKHTIETFRKAVEKINEYNSDLIVHSGDVTMNSMLHEFETARAELKALKGNTMFLPGPRDYYPLGIELFDNYISPKESTHTDSKMIVQGFDTCTLAEKTGKLGRLNTRKIIEKSLGSAKINVVAMHHNIVPLSNARHTSELKDAGDVLFDLTQNGIDLILTGSKNYPGCWQVENTVIVNSGTVSSTTINTKKGNSFCVIDIYRSMNSYIYQIYEIYVNLDEKRLMAQYVIPITK